MDTITAAQAKKVLEVVDAGLTAGLGDPIPGEMCVEAAVCYALGGPHGDEPSCVDRTIRALKIRLNDSSWSSPQARAEGMRKLALLQLGSKDNFDGVAFVQRLVPLARAATAVARDAAATAAAADAAAADAAAGAAAYAADAVRAAVADTAYAADAADADVYIAAAAARAAAYAADAVRAAARAARAADAVAWTANAARAARAADAVAWTANAARADATRDKVLAQFAEDVAQILIDMKVPGTQWLDLL